MADVCFVLGNFTVLLIIILSTMKKQKIDMLFMTAVYLLTMGTIYTGAFTSENSLQFYNVVIMSTECILIAYNKIKYRGE